MSTATRERKSSAQKTVQVIARVEFKCDSRKVCYLVRGSHGEQYQTCLFDGKACSCTCPARKPCYHMVQVETKEAERMDVQEVVHIDALPVPNADGNYKTAMDWLVATDAQEYKRESVDQDAQMEQWTHEELSREAYVQMFRPCEWEGVA